MFDRFSCCCFLPKLNAFLNRSGHGTNRRTEANPKPDKTDPLHGVRKPMPYDTLVKQLEENPDAEIRR